MSLFLCGGCVTCLFYDNLVTNTASPLLAEWPRRLFRSLTIMAMMSGALPVGMDYGGVDMNIGFPGQAANGGLSLMSFPTTAFFLLTCLE